MLLHSFTSLAGGILALAVGAASLPVAAQDDPRRIEAMKGATPLHVEARDGQVSILALRKNEGLFRITDGGDTLEGTAKETVATPLIRSSGDRYNTRARKSGEILNLAARVTKTQALDLLFGEIDSLVFAEEDAKETEPVLYHFTPEGRDLGVSFLEGQRGTIAFAVDGDGRYYVGNSETDAIVSFTTNGEGRDSYRPEFESNRGILSGLRGVQMLRLIDNDSKMLALNSLDGEMRLIDLQNRRPRPLSAPILDTKRGWVNVAVNEEQARMVLTDTFRAIEGKQRDRGFDARLGIVSYSTDPYALLELTSFDIGALFFHDLNNAETLRTAKQEDASIRVVFNPAGDIFAIHSRLSQNVVFYRLAPNYLERINVLTLPENARSVFFAGDTSVVISGGNETFLYDDVTQWQKRNRLFSGVEVIRDAQRELSILFTPTPPTRLRLVDGFIGSDTEKLFRLYAQQRDLNLPENLFNKRNAKDAAETILADLVMPEQMIEPANLTGEGVGVTEPVNNLMAAYKALSEQDMVASGLVTATDSDIEITATIVSDDNGCNLTKNDRFILELSFASLDIDRMPILCARFDKQRAARPIQIDLYSAEDASDGVALSRDPIAYQVDCAAIQLFVDDKIGIPLRDDTGGGLAEPDEKNQHHLRRALSIQSGWQAVNNLCFNGDVSLTK